MDAEKGYGEEEADSQLPEELHRLAVDLRSAPPYQIDSDYRNVLKEQLLEAIRSSRSSAGEKEMTIDNTNEQKWQLLSQEGEDDLFLWSDIDEPMMVNEMLKDPSSHYWEECRQFVMQYVQAIMKSAESARRHEVVQEVMEKIRKALPHFQFRCALKIWIITIIEHCVDRANRKSLDETNSLPPLQEEVVEGDERERYQDDPELATLVHHLHQAPPLVAIDSVFREALHEKLKNMINGTNSTNTMNSDSNIMDVAVTVHHGEHLRSLAEGQEGVLLANLTKQLSDEGKDAQQLRQVLLEIERTPQKYQERRKMQQEDTGLLHFARKCFKNFLVNLKNNENKGINSILYTML